MSSIFLLNLPFAYIFYKFGSKAEVILYIEMCSYIIALLARLFLLKKMLGFSVNYYLCEVVGRSLVVVFTSLIVPFYFALSFPSGWSRLGIVCGCSVLFTSGFGYILGLNRNEKCWLKHKIKQKLNIMSANNDQ